MTITYVASTEIAYAATSAPITLPGGWAADDLCIIHCWYVGSGGTIATPAGWTLIPGFPFTTGTSNRLYVWYRKLVGGDAGPTFTLTNNNVSSWITLAYRGQNLTTPFPVNAKGDVSGVGPLSYAMRDFAYNNMKIVSFRAHGSTPTVPVPTTANGYTVRETFSTTLGNDHGLAIYDKDLPDAWAGDTGPIWPSHGISAHSLYAFADATQRNHFAAAGQGSTGTQARPYIYPPEILFGTPNAGGSTPASAAIPSTVQTGDRMYVVFIGASGGTVFGTPAGWTQVYNVRTTGSNRHQCFTKVYEPGDANPSATYTSSSWRAVVFYTRGSTTTHTVAPAGFDEGYTSTASPQIAAPLNDYPEKLATLVAVYGTASTGFTTVAAAEGYTTRLTYSNTPGLWIGTKEVRDDYLDHPAPSVNKTSAGNPFSATFAIKSDYQPTRFRATQGGAGTGVWVRTFWPEPVLGTVYKANSGTTYGPVPLPTNLRDGDVMVMICAGTAGGGTFGTPAGWTLKKSVRSSTSNRLMVFTKVYASGDAAPSSTYSSSPRLCVIVGYRFAAQYDKDIGYGFDEGNPNSSASIADMPVPDLTGINDTYSEALAIWFKSSAGVITLKSGSEEGFTEYLSDEVSGQNLRVLLARKQHLGSSNIEGPTATTASPFRSMAIMLQIEGEFQPKEIAASATEGQAGTNVIITAEQGFPIEAIAIEGQAGTALRIKVTKPRSRKPQRELIWIHGYDGERIGVID